MHRIRIERDQDAIVLTAQGELDAYSAPELTERLDEARADGGLPLVVDLSSVSFMDSTALGVIARTLTAAPVDSAPSRIVLPTTAARRIFEITTLDSTLPVASSRAAALLELQKAR